MNSASSPLIVAGSTCCWLLSHMKLLPSRWVGDAFLLCFYHRFPFALTQNEHICSFRSPVEKLIKQRTASGPTGTEKRNRYWLADEHLLSQSPPQYFKHRTEDIRLSCYSFMLFFLLVLPAVPFQNGESSSTVQWSSASGRCEAPPSSHECSSPTEWEYASSPTRRDACSTSSPWCARYPSDAPSDAHATNADEAATSRWPYV